MVEITCAVYVVQKHPTLNIWVRDDGAVFVKKRWYYGYTTKDGYKRLTIGKKGYQMHRILAETLLANPDNKPTVDHIDRDRANNHVWNLRWATHHEQNQNTIAIDRSVNSYGCRFSEEPNKYRRAYYSKHKDKFARDYKATYQKHKEYYREYARKRRKGWAHG